MSVLALDTAARAPRALRWVPAATGVVALLARPWFLPAGVDGAWRVAFFVALGAVGLAGGDVEVRRAGLRASLWAFGLGALAFAAGRGLLAVPLRPSGLALAVALNALAAVAEEAFFRRHVYGRLYAAFGPAAAVAGSAALFAVVHVPVWGWWVLPLDLAAGLVLSWQRAVTGRWSVPAATHVLANTLALL